MAVVRLLRRAGSDGAQPSGSSVAWRAGQTKPAAESALGGTQEGSEEIVGVGAEDARAVAQKDAMGVGTMPKPDFRTETELLALSGELQGAAAPIAVSSLRPFFGFYGGKWRDSVKFYPPPRYQTIVEPFAGSAGYSVRYADRRVVLCEADPVIAAVWRYLTQVTPEEILSIPDVPVDGSVDDLHLAQEASWLVGFWVNRGTARPRKRPSRWMRDQIRPGSFWGERVRQTIAAQVSAIRHWEVHNCSYEECPVAGPATWFIDPPYQAAGRYYAYGARNLSFEHLAEWCRTRVGQVVVCENVGADWLPFVPLADVKTTRSGRKSQEVMWTKDAG